MVYIVVFHCFHSIIALDLIPFSTSSIPANLSSTSPLHLIYRDVSENLLASYFASADHIQLKA